MTEDRIPEDVGSRSSSPDSVRLHLLNASFGIAREELERRRGRGAPAPGPSPSTPDAETAEAASLAAAFGAHVARLDDAELERLEQRLARSLLLELDRRMAGLGPLPGGRPDLTRFATAADPPAPGVAEAGPLVGLVSMPWMSPALPSIQLATLASALEREGIGCDVHELFVDYGARIGLNLYNHLGNLLGYLPEWVFSRHYYGPEKGDDLTEMIAQRPLAEIPWPQFADSLLEALEPVTREYLDDVMSDVDWSRYDVLGFSLTISQLGASMALARMIKLAHPGVRIVFGGSQCAGPMGRAILRICPYVDVVVHIEGELVLPDLVRRLCGGASPDGLPGVSWRDADGVVVSSTSTALFHPDLEKLPVDYEAYFRRLIRLGVDGKMNPWLPFESSRGCWYGQKVQCTFCGLHEIMEFRAWDGDVVLAELERLAATYGVGRFYSMDLIMPREYLRTMLPEIVRRGHDWMFFYEMKANLRRTELEVMAAAGVRWIQPGIESLDSDLLKLMRKGVSPAQNILLLKWSGELGIFCGWNLLYGLPGESQDSYDRMAELIPKLGHLQPPSGGGQFQLHRFSPYFDRPEEYGIRWTGAHPMFRYAFPESQADLDELVYLHEFEVEDGGSLADVRDVENAVEAWRRAYKQGATLRIEAGPDAGSAIVDHRDPDSPPVVHRLDAAETELYAYLDRNLSERALLRDFAGDHADAFASLGGPDGVREALARWDAAALVVIVDEKILGLALRAAETTADLGRRADAAEAPPADVVGRTAALT